VPTSSDMAFVDSGTFNNSCIRGEKSDIFSIMGFLVERSPCEGNTRSYDILVYRRNGFRDSPISGTLQEYINLYSAYWDEDPDKRPFMHKQCVNKMFEGVLWVLN
jgi:hypothetical protein